VLLKASQHRTNSHINRLFAPIERSFLARKSQ
jgi:hypothetical protein